MSKRRSVTIIDFSRSFRIISSIIFYLTLWLVRAFNRTVFGLTVTGKTNLWPARAFLVSNHSRFLDPAFVADAIRPRRTFFSVLEQTLDIPLLGYYVRLLGGFPLPDRLALVRTRTAVRTALRTSGLIHFFPEGQLHLGAKILRSFRHGVFLLAVREGIPVIPITIVVRNRIWRGRTLNRWPPRVYAVIADPVDPSMYLMQECSRIEAARAMAADVHALMKAAQTATPAGRRSLRRSS